MKKVFILIATICMAFVSCSKDNGFVDGGKPAQEFNVSDIKLNFNVAEMIGGGTKAAKTNWEEGDKINLWFDDLDVISLKGDQIGRAELVLTYTGGEWKAEFDDFYATHTDDKGKLDGLLWTLENKNNRTVKCLYEGSNNIGNYHVYIDQYDYTFTPVQWFWKCQKCNEENAFELGKCQKCGEDKPSNDKDLKLVHVPNNIVPLMSFSAQDYTYDENTKTITIDTIQNWSMLTMIQVTVAGLDSAEANNYTLSCNNMSNVQSIYINGESTDSYANNGYDPTRGVSNADGVAFCFYDTDYCGEEADYEFTLSDGTNTWIHTTYAKTIETSSDNVKFISINKSKFKQ